MPDGSELLRLLEPAVRPVGGGTPGQPKTPDTFEGKSFDQLLADAAQRGPEPAVQPSTDAVADPTDTAAPDRTAAPINLGHVENPSLARLLAERSAANPPATPDLS
ncbi:MAG: hypothetical protein AAF842_04475 [Planctomycetota bacterium]